MFSERPQQDPEFLRVSTQIAKNLEILRAADKLQYRKDTYPINTSPILCEIRPGSVFDDSFTFHINARQESERTVTPSPDLVFKNPTADVGDLDVFLAGVEKTQFVLSAISAQRTHLHYLTQLARQEQISIVRAKSASDKLGEYKTTAEKYVDSIIEQFPEGSNPDPSDLEDEGIPLDRYQRIFSQREAVVTEFAQELMDFEQQDSAQHIGYYAEQLGHLDAMETKAEQGLYQIRIESLPHGYLMNVSVEFK